MLLFWTKIYYGFDVMRPRFALYSAILVLFLSFSPRSVL